MLFLCLFDMRLFGFVCFFFLLVSAKGYSLCLWHSLDFSLTFLHETNFFHILVKPSFMAENFLYFGEGNA